MKSGGADSCSGYILERQLKRRFNEVQALLMRIPENVARSRPLNLMDIMRRIEGKGAQELKLISQEFNDKGYRFAFIKLFGLKKIPDK